MPATYSITGTGSNQTLTPTAGSGLPVIRVGAGLSSLNLQSFVDALNRKISTSPTYASQLAWATPEGITVIGVTYNPRTTYLNSNQNLATKIDPRFVGGFAVYNGWDQGSGTFVNRPNVPFEIQAQVEQRVR
jgi:hypothetical protein